MSTALSEAQFARINRAANATAAQTDQLIPKLKSLARTAGFDTTVRNESVVHRDLEGNYLGHTTQVRRGRRVHVQQRDAQGNVVAQRREMLPRPGQPWSWNRRETVSRPGEVPNLFGLPREQHFVQDTAEPDSLAPLRSRSRSQSPEQPVGPFSDWPPAAGTESATGGATGGTNGTGGIRWIPSQQAPLNTSQHIGQVLNHLKNQRKQERAARRNQSGNFDAVQPQDLRPFSQQPFKGRSDYGNGGGGGSFGNPLGPFST